MLVFQVLLFSDISYLRNFFIKFFFFFWRIDSLYYLPAVTTLFQITIKRSKETKSKKLLQNLASTST